MSKKKSAKRNILEWLIILSVIAFLYFTGLYTDVMGKVQQLVLMTGVVTPELNIPPDKQQNAYYNLTLKSLNNDLVSLRKFKGKVIFLNFWASWCPPCRAEMPGIQSLYDKLKDNNNIVFVMVSLDEDTSKAKKFIKGNGFTFPVYFSDGYLPGIYSSGTIPSTYVISKQGKIVVKEVGMSDYNTGRFQKFLTGL